MQIDFMNRGKLEIWWLQNCVITVTKLGALKEEDYKTKKLRRKKCFIVTQKKISKNIIKSLRLTTKQTGFLLQNQQKEQNSKTSRHPHKMTKDGKYGKLTIDVQQLVEKHRLLAKEAGAVLLDEKVDSGFIDLISKTYDTKKKYFNLSKLYSKHLLIYQVLKIRKEVRNLKI